MAWYGTEEDADTEGKEVGKCGLCGGDPMKKGNLKDTVVRLIPQVTAAEREAKLTAKFGYFARRYSCRLR